MFKLADLVRRVRNRPAVTIGSAATVLIIGPILWHYAGTSAVTTLDGVPTAVVTRGAMVVSVTEAGEVQSEKRKVISNELQMPVVILEVVEEGKRVEAGDTIIRFECKELEDDISNQKLAVTSAENDFFQAQENIKLTQQKVESEVRKAENALIDAESDLKKFREHEATTKASDAEANIKLAESDLKLATGKLAAKLKINEDPELNSPYSKNELDADELSVERLRLKLQQAQSTFEALKLYDIPKDQRTKELNVNETRLAVEQARVSAKTQMLIAQAAMLDKQRQMQMRQDRLKEYLEGETKLIVKADRSGLIVYDTGSSRWNPTPVNVAVGEKVNPRQQLMVIPDMTTLSVSTKVYEAVVKEVKLGTHANIRLDARRDELYTGKVTKLAVLPDSQNRWWDPSHKVYPVLVTFDRPPPDLKPGMTAQVELILAELDNVMSVPIAAVYTEQEQTFIWKVTSGQATRTPVRVGRMNESRVEVISGLEEGDTVLLAPPPGMQLLGAPKNPAENGQSIAASQPTSQPVTQPTTEPAEPMTQPASEPASEPASQPVS